MATVPADVQGPSDSELIDSVRGGKIEAYGELYERHVSAAYNLARQLTRSPAEADDLVSEAFAKVLDTLRGGRGPDSAFRAYLLTALRHTAYDKTRRDRKVELSDDVSAVSGVPAEAVSVPFSDTAVAGLERSLAAKAFARLPERWQTVLWHTEIEGQSPAEVGPLLGLTANGVSALAYRAREGLRQAYLQVHLTETTSDRCRATVDRLGAWTRGGLSKRETTQVEAHLDECDRCRALAAELSDVNGSLRGFVAPLVLGLGATGYLAVTAGAGKAVAATAVAGAAGAGGAAGAAASLPRQLLGVAASTAALAVAVAIGLTSGGGDTTPAIAEPPPAPVVTSQPVVPPVPPAPPAVVPAVPPAPPAPQPQPDPPSPEPAPAPAAPPAETPPPAQPQPTPAALVPTVPSGFTLVPGEAPKALPITIRNTGESVSEPASMALALPPGVRSVGPVASFAGARLLALDGLAEQTVPCPAGSGTVTCTTAQGIAPGGTATFVFNLQADPEAVGGTITGTVSAGTTLTVAVTVAVEVQPVRDDLVLTVRKWHEVFWDPRLDVTVTNTGTRAGPLTLSLTTGDGIVLTTPCAGCSVRDHRIECRAELQRDGSYRMSAWAFGLPFRGGTVRVTATVGTASKSVDVPVSLLPGVEAPVLPPSTPELPPVTTAPTTTVPSVPSTTAPTTTTTPVPTTTTPPETPPTAPGTPGEPVAPPVVPTPPTTPPTTPPPATTPPCTPWPPWWPPVLGDLLPGYCQPPP
ncbi:sigma-70 family RNA polymerase sigma factor [Umezawaea tangerina]|uniref:RNA polymerase sigma factor (Sigma-70 family) n=1 Tax=Umezawaea tangerina TaxID=84725 RepID=A0A2T0TDW2_9PSEU|nr:sigma-70 family RNA polymerase sigma factor [Umezawaea tangerina]PRY43814.1 RNA polymerase sigma factor (sigma-70 family) [Umezawaea tangerina]